MQLVSIRAYKAIILEKKNIRLSTFLQRFNYILVFAYNILIILLFCEMNNLGMSRHEDIKMLFVTYN